MLTGGAIYNGNPEVGGDVHRGSNLQPWWKLHHNQSGWEERLGQHMRTIRNICSMFSRSIALGGFARMHITYDLIMHAHLRAFTN